MDALLAPSDEALVAFYLCDAVFPLVDDALLPDDLLQRTNRTLRRPPFVANAPTAVVAAAMRALYRPLARLRQVTRHYATAPWLPHLGTMLCFLKRTVFRYRLLISTDIDRALVFGGYGSASFAKTAAVYLFRGDKDAFRLVDVTNAAPDVLADDMRRCGFAPATFCPARPHDMIRVARASRIGNSMSRFPFVTARHGALLFLDCPQHARALAAPMPLLRLLQQRDQYQVGTCSPYRYSDVLRWAQQRRRLQELAAAAAAR